MGLSHLQPHKSIKRDPLNFYKQGKPSRNCLDGFPLREVINMRLSKSTFFQFLIVTFSCLVIASCSGPNVVTPTVLNPTVSMNSTQSSNQLQTLGEPQKLSGKVVYQTNGSVQNNVMLLDMATSQVKDLTNDGSSIDPVFSPDGKQIAYACGTKAKNREICIMDAEGNNKRTLTDTSGEKWGVNWSPDGKQIAFVSNEIPNAHIFIVDLASNKTHKLLANPQGNDSSPSWSPDGQWIAFASDRKGFNLYKVKPDGSQEQQISNGNTDDRPSWSPDGKFILFRRIAKDSSFFNGNEVMIMDADGKNVRMLTDNYVGDDWPSFSKDGKWIIFADEVKDNTYQLLVMKVEGGLPSPVIKGGILGTAPSWH
jgi:tol-pal system beta propeller repeat protein TolB